MEFLPLQDRELLRIMMITREVDDKFLSCTSHLQKHPILALICIMIQIQKISTGIWTTARQDSCVL